ncbi:Uncharacterised protein [Raoultella terrigena]|uniref:Uncharacterized protein n=1 Tax=Raoultella terrigena TaxID=577 RepID=A0A4V6J102_RAOTE|nr:Uncharacterised protein [Raoultella terrigena]
MVMSPGPLLSWLKLLTLSAALSFVLFWLHLPAALRLGPMIAGHNLQACAARQSAYLDPFLSPLRPLLAA